MNSTEFEEMDDNSQGALTLDVSETSKEEVTWSSNETYFSDDFSSGKTLLSNNGRKNHLGDFSRKLCCCCRFFTCRDLLRLCCYFLLCAPCFLLIIVIVLVVSFIISFYSGRVTLRETNVSSVIFLNKFVEKHIRSTKVGVNQLSISGSVIDLLCNHTHELQNEVDNLLLGFVEYNDFYLHHVRLILANGSEISRIDLEHDHSATISDLKYDVSGSDYHQDYLLGKSIQSPFVGRWTTHGPLENGDHYEYIGSDLTGDHHSNHEEYLPLPQLVKIQKAVMCDESSSAGYVIVNVRMVVLLTEIEVVGTSKHYLIIDEEGEYIFNNQEREKEFQKVTKKDSTLEQDWGGGIRNKMFKVDGNLQAKFTQGISEFLCHLLVIDENQYSTCLVIPSIEAFTQSPISILVGILVIIIYLFLIISCGLMINLAAQSKTQRFKNLVGNLYPPKISKQLFHGKKIIATFESDICVMFADICRFVEMNESFSNDPHCLVHTLGNIVEVIDVFAGLHGVYKVKTIGDCYFGVSGLNFGKKRASDDKQLKRNVRNLQKMAMMACLLLRFFEKRSLLLPNGLDEVNIRFRIGISFGGAVAGILNKTTPYYDLWGRCINLAARMEATSIPGKVHISSIVFEYLKKDPSCHKLFEFYKRSGVRIKGFGECVTYFVQIKSNDTMDNTLSKMMNHSLKKFRKVFPFKTDEKDTIINKPKSASMYETCETRVNEDCKIIRIPTDATRGNLDTGCSFDKIEPLHELDVNKESSVSTSESTSSENFWTRSRGVKDDDVEKLNSHEMDESSEQGILDDEFDGTIISISKNMPKNVRFVEDYQEN